VRAFLAAVSRNPTFTAYRWEVALSSVAIDIRWTKMTEESNFWPFGNPRDGTLFIMQPRFTTGLLFGLPSF
jgi:hypothetical protein